MRILKKREMVKLNNKKNETIFLSIIFYANSLNYGEGTGTTTSEIKKFTRSFNGTSVQYSRASRQSIRSSIVAMGAKEFGWNMDVVELVRKVVQFKKDANITDSVEMDLFGYMRTEKGKNGDTRPAKVRLSDAISLEPYRGDVDYMTNMALAKRIDTNAMPTISEQHHSLYSYSVSIDLADIGIDNDIELSKEEKYNRVIQLIDIIQFLYREIRARRENLSPWFVIGGKYPFGNPVFHGLLELDTVTKAEKPVINIKPLLDKYNAVFAQKNIKDYTKVGILEGKFSNEEAIKEQFGKDNVLSVSNYFQWLKEQVKDYYELDRGNENE